MTENRRIILNVVATYGRTLFTVACGLFAGRWALMALGQTDYGLQAVVGALMVFIAFINSVLAGAISRFYAVSVGQAKVSGRAGVEECRRWFNTALTIHTAVPLALLAVGYPVGTWAVEHWLTIPPDRIEACRWVFRFACLSGFVGMVNVPFAAMYTAKQYIAELTLYSFATTTLNVCFLYYMVTHPGDWLARYALWSCLLSVVPQAIICLRAMAIFPECRLRWRYWYDLPRLRQVGAYAGWQMLGSFCGLLRTQGISVLINKAFGPNVNAAMGVAQSVNGKAFSLAAAMLGAFSPAITTAFGEGDIPKMKRMALRSCRFGLLLSLPFLLPLALELPEVMRLWLKTPPDYAVGLCWCMIALYLTDVCTQGHMVIVNASGKIAAYHVVLSAISIFTLPAAWLCVRLGLGVYVSIGGVLIVAIALNSLGRVWFARRLLGMGARAWLFGVMVPVVALTALCGAVGLLPQLWLGPSFWRLLLTTALTEALFLPLAWRFVLDADERAYAQNALRRIAGRFVRVRGGA